jgi:hypothetical protein
MVGNVAKRAEAEPICQEVLREMDDKGCFRSLLLVTRQQLLAAKTFAPDLGTI